MSESKPKQPLQWFQTVLLGIIVTGGGALLKELRDDVKSNAATMIRVEERQTTVIKTLPEMQSEDRSLRNEIENTKKDLRKDERELDNHEYRLKDVEKELKVKPKQP